ncbi:hypothetical protein Tco_1357423, partial [Tanacetum coccineum]
KGCLALSLVLQQGLFGTEFNAAAWLFGTECSRGCVVLQQGMFSIEFSAAARVVWY